MRTTAAVTKSDLLWRRTAFNDGSGCLWFFSNPWDKPLTQTVAFDAPGDLVEVHSEDGTLTDAAAYCTDGKAEIALSLPAYGHRLFFAASGAFSQKTNPATAKLPKLGRDQLSFQKAEREETNQLYIDYGKLYDRHGKEVLSHNTIQLDQANWKAHGFEQNPWSMAHQFNRTLQEYPFPEDSGFAVEYVFTINEMPEGELTVLLERPWLYDISINGQVIPQERFTSYFDEEFAQAPLSGLKVGQNSLRMEAPKMDALAEIMPIYIRGEFTVSKQDSGFAIEPIKGALTEGFWTQQGFPMYRGWVHYDYAFELKEDVPGLEIELPDWKGACAQVSLDAGEQTVPVLFEKRPLTWALPLAAGKHTLRLRVASDLGNMVGPHHSEGKAVGTWSYIFAPKEQPAGAAYRIADHGIRI